MDFLKIFGHNYKDIFHYFSKLISANSSVQAQGASVVKNRGYQFKKDDFAETSFLNTLSLIITGFV